MMELQHQRLMVLAGQLQLESLITERCEAFCIRVQIHER